MTERLVSRGLRRFRSDARGNIAVASALTLPVIVGAVAIAVEITQINAQKSRLQGIADGAALAAARELRLGNATAATVIGVARNHAAASAGHLVTDYEFAGELSADKRTIKVTLVSRVAPSLGQTAGIISRQVSAVASARVMGGAPVCAVGLDPVSAAAFSLEKQARLQAPNCAVYVNSRHANGLDVRDSAMMTAAFSCTAGGYKGGAGSLTPAPNTDCPAFPDPLASRPAPAIAACDPKLQDFTIEGSDVFLTPGTYCGGITISKNSIVTMQPGVYIIKDGELSIGGGSTLKGTNVGLFFTGAAAGMDMKKDSTISLTAPKTGEMAGLLFYQDRDTGSSNAKFEISSDSATVLLGTIYIPRGRLYLGGEKPVAQNSAYTIVVARMFELSAGPTMVLNTDYSASDVPVPQGVGPLSNDVALQPKT